MKVLKGGKAGTPGAGRRQLQSWIESFVEFTDNLGSSEIFRRWTAIAVLGALLEQKVWLQTTSPIYPNLYTFLVGGPGVGKTRTIMRGREFLAGVPEFHIAPTSMTMASLVDNLVKCKRFKQRLAFGEPPLDYNTMTMLTDDWQAFMSAYEKDLIAGLTQFYDCWPYRRTRTTKDIDHEIPRPQLNLLAGTTPSDLFEFMPVGAWGQGFTSRVVLIFSSESSVVDDLVQEKRPLPPGMIHDFALINEVIGEFKWTPEYRAAVMAWRAKDEEPKPTHPKLLHYNARRRVHIYKLSMIHAIDRGSPLVLEEQDFTQALRWLQQAELCMTDIFDQGQQSVDDAAMDEIVEYVRRTNGTGMMKQTLYRKASRTVAITKIRDVVDMLVLGGRLDFRDDKFFVKD